MDDEQWSRVSLVAEDGVSAVTEVFARTTLGPQETSKVEPGVPWGQLSGREFLDSATRSLQGGGDTPAGESLDPLTRA
eukprot:8699156-Lingulodinium_polyedra.AAC.1